MFLDIDKKPSDRLAALDDVGNVASYGLMCEFARTFGKVVAPRALIFILAENSIDSLLGYVGAMTSNVVPLILSKNTNTVLLQTLISTYTPQYLWLPKDMAQQLGGSSVYETETYSMLRLAETSPTLHDELAMLLPTSGSTGSPKLVRHSMRNIEANAENVARMFRITQEDNPIASLPMHYTMGLSVISSHLYAGATLHLSSLSLTDMAFWRRMKQEHVTSFTGVPFSFEVLHKIRFFRMDLPDLRWIAQGGGKMSNDLFRECAEYAERTGKLFYATYGQTECTARMAYLPPELATKKTGSIGIAEPGGQLSIIDAEGNETFEGEAEGEMVFRGENVTLGYATCVEDLQKGDENHGVMRTGDIARRDSDGCHYIVGRMKRFLKIFGLRIGLDEVENLVKSEFGCDCLCGGTDEMLRAIITNAEMLQQVKDFIVEKTHLYHSNIDVQYVAEIARNEAGKVVMHQ